MSALPPKVDICALAHVHYGPIADIASAAVAGRPTSRQQRHAAHCRGVSKGTVTRLSRDRRADRCSASDFQELRQREHEVIASFGLVTLKASLEVGAGPESTVGFEGCIFPFAIT